MKRKIDALTLKNSVDRASLANATGTVRPNVYSERFLQTMRKIFE